MVPHHIPGPEYPVIIRDGPVTEDRKISTAGTGIIGDPIMVVIRVRRRKKRIYIFSRHIGRSGPVFGRTRSESTTGFGKDDFTPHGIAADTIVLLFKHLILRK